MRAALLALVLLAPVAQAGVPFEIELPDRAGDTRDIRDNPADTPESDILNFTSRVEDGKVVLLVEMAATPAPPEDWILVRSWFANSTNGSYHIVDVEVTDEPAAPGAWVVGTLRDGGFDDARSFPVTWAIENRTWRFEYDASLVENATCYDPAVFTRHNNLSEPPGYDNVYLPKRRCAMIAEPARPATPTVPAVQISVRSPDAENAPTVAAPGSRTPTPGAGVALVAVAMVAVALLARRR